MYHRIEFQHRGSPHVHMIIWLDGASVFDLENEETHKQVEDFIDKIITTSSNDESASNFVKYQYHINVLNYSYLPTRGSSNKKSCRFDAPFIPTRSTKILLPFNANELEYLSREKSKFHRELMTRVKDFLNTISEEIENFDIS